MNKFYHFKRNAFPAIFGMVLALCSFSSVAFGGSHSTNEATENFKPAVVCQSAFYPEAAESTVLSAGVFTFYNFSEGDYTSASWDFGDGTTSNSTAASVNHIYNESGTYEVSLSVWDDNYSCYSTSTQTVNINLAPEDPCDFNSCVLPGDANNDGKADLNDLLNIGVGFGATGPARPDADPMSWEPQTAPDWTQETPYGVNYKHFDSDGDGLIDYQDIPPLLYHYSPMDNGIGNTVKSAPRVYLDFDVDSIVVDQNTPDYVTLSAGVVVGSSTKPMEDIYGMSLYFEYDSTLTEAYDGVEISYNNSSFFGEQGETVNFGKDLRAEQQYDMGITRVDGQNISGYGRVATVNFIVIIDIIGGRAEEVVPFDVPISGITVVDNEGNIVPVSLEETPSTVVFIKETTTSIVNKDLDHNVKVFPNPATDNINISLTDLTGEYAQLYNSLGQLMMTHTFNQSNTSIAVDDLSPGVYLLNVQTDKGLVNKRIIVE